MNKLSIAQQNYLSAEKRHRFLVRSARTILLFLLLLGWELSARAGLLNDFIFSSPSRIAGCFLSMAGDGSIFRHIGITMGETLISFLLVTILSVLCAMVLWSNRFLFESLEPYLVMLNSLPKSALAPVLIVWLGNNVRTIIVVGILIAVFGSMITLVTSFYEVDSDKIKLIYSLGGHKKDVLLKVLLPSSIPIIVSTMKVNIGLCLVGIIIGEFLAANAGLGYLIIYGSQVFKMDLVMMSIFILCILSVFLYQGIHLMEKKLTK